jgi:hypothetical protein
MHTTKWALVKRAILQKTVQTQQSFIEFFHSEKETEKQLLKITHQTGAILFIR